MGLLDRFKRNDHPSEVQYAIASGVASADAGRPPSDIDRERQLAENSLLMEDPDISSFLKGLCTIKYKDVNNNDVSYVVPKYVAAKILGTTLIRSSYIDKKESQLGIINSRCIMRRIKMKMSEQEYERGGALVIDALNEVVRLNYLCAENGRMALVMKSSPRSVEVKVGKTQEKKD